MWDKVFQNGPSEICRRHPLKNLKYGLNRPYHFILFKGCLPQISPGPFLNTLFHIVFIHNVEGVVQSYTTLIYLIDFDQPSDKPESRKSFKKKLTK